MCQEKSAGDKRADATPEGVGLQEPGKPKVSILADGAKITRRLGEARFRLDGEEGTSSVIFWEKGDSTLLGSISLEVLGIMFDPFRPELRPLLMMLASRRSA